MRRCSVFLGLLTGCGSVFDLEVVEDDTNGELVGERPAFCATAAAFDAFDGSIPCAFGAPFEEAALAQDAGVFAITVDGSRPVLAGCTAFRPYPFTDNGVFLRVLEPLLVPNAYTRFQIRHSYQTLPEMQAYIQFDIELRFVVDGIQIVTRPDAPEWWRLRLLGGTSTVAAELSDDGLTWAPWATAEVSIPESIAVDIAAGVASTPSAPGSARLSAFGICN